MGRVHHEIGAALKPGSSMRVLAQVIETPWLRGKFDLVRLDAISDRALLGFEEYVKDVMAVPGSTTATGCPEPVTGG